MLSKKERSTLILIIDEISWYLALTVIAVVLLSSLQADSGAVRGEFQFMNQPCDELYEVGEGETLHTIIDKCGDPYIVEENPHIHDPDDVFPGLIIKITPPPPRNR